MIGIGDALSFVADVIDGENEVNSAIKKSNNKTKRNVVGIAALGAIAAFGIHAFTNNTKEQKNKRKKDDKMLGELFGALVLDYLHDDFNEYKETRIKQNQQKNNIITGAAGVATLGALAVYGIHRMSQSDKKTNSATK